MQKQYTPVNSIDSVVQTLKDTFRNSQNKLSLFLYVSTFLLALNREEAAPTPTAAELLP